MAEDENDQTASPLRTKSVQSISVCFECIITLSRQIHSGKVTGGFSTSSSTGFWTWDTTAFCESCKQTISVMAFLGAFSPRYVITTYPQQSPEEENQ